MNVSSLVDALKTDCDAAALGAPGLQSVCDMIPTNFATNADADLDNVSDYYMQLYVTSGSVEVLSCKE